VKLSGGAMQHINPSEFFSTRDFRHILRTAFQERKARRTKYSMNAFARDVGLEPPRLNAILKGRYGISREVAESIGSRLGFSEEMTAFFKDLASFQHGRTELERKEAAVRLSKFTPQSVRVLNKEELHLLDKWFYPATLHLIEVNDGSVTPESISSSLRISIVQANEALNVLMKLGEITIQKGIYRTTPKISAGSSALPNETVQKFHIQFLDQIKEAITREPVLKRKNRSTYIAFDSSRIEEARVWLEQMHSKFLAEFCIPEHGDSVFNLGIYLSRADQEKRQC
jgi:uncharacterized protein (TIGR02147 family)